MVDFKKKIAVAEELLNRADKAEKLAGLEFEAKVMKNAATLIMKTAKNELEDELAKAQSDAKRQYGDQSQDAVLKYDAKGKEEAQKALSSIRAKLAKAEALQTAAEKEAKDFLNSPAPKNDKTIGGGDESKTLFDVKPGSGKEASKIASKLEKAFKVAFPTA